MPYCAPEFQIKELSEEVEAFCETIEGFITPESSYALSLSKDQLRSFAKQKSNRVFDWSIPDQDGARLRTVETRGFEPHPRAGAYGVVGEFSFTWKMQLTPATKDQAFVRQKIAVVGNASTKLRVIEASSNKLIAQWQVEIGAEGSPGTYFHVGVGQHEGMEFFPHSLTVPRLPSVLVTPTDALDFLLGELFQSEWRKANGVDSEYNRIIGRNQRARLHRLLSWQAEQLPRDCSGSAWSALKHAKPSHPIFAD